MRGRITTLAWALIVVGAIAFASKFWGRDEGAPTEYSQRDRIAAELTPDRTVPIRDGLAAAILIDVSGSMRETVAGDPRAPKIETARRAALDLVSQFVRYAADHKGEPVMLGLYEFSSPEGGADYCREVVAMGPPDRAGAEAAIARMRPDGGTPIGEAMIRGKKALDATGLARRHLLVVTDGQNTTGVPPEWVATAIGKRPELERPSIYFVAFDIDANRFNAIRETGGLVLAAANARELTETLDTLLRGKILVER